MNAAVVENPVTGKTGVRKKACLVVLAALFLYGLTGQSGAETSIRDSMVKIYTVETRPDYDNPWNLQGPLSVTGSGSVIGGNRILTNAHMVSDQTFIQVRLHGKARKYPARVIAVSHPADLAILGVDDPSFFKDVKPLQLGDLPPVQQDVIVYGFPHGGDTLSTTKGVISRVEHQEYVHSTINLLAGQLDAAINPGNSGGPVIVGDRIVGVVMQSLSKSQNIGYMVPVPIVKHFLEDIEDGKVDGFPEDGIVMQAMENMGLRKKYKLGEGRSGVLVVSVLPGTPSEGKVFPGDVLLSADGYDIADDGTVEFRPGERTAANYCTQIHQVGEEMVLSILRGGEELTVSIPLDLAWGRHTLVPMMLYDQMPTYYIYGGLVFVPLTRNYLQTWGKDLNDDPPTGLARYILNDTPRIKGEEVVIVSRVLSAEVNDGYEDHVNQRITHVNRKGIRDLMELVKIVEKSRDPFVDFGFEDGVMIVLDRETAENQNSEILRTYRVPHDRSEDLRSGKYERQKKGGNR